MESDIMRTLGFNLTRASSLLFFERYIRLITGDERVLNLGLYLLELALVDYRFIKYVPSNLAVSALYLSLKIFKKLECWNPTLEMHAKYNEIDIRMCAKDLCIVLQNVMNSK
jgi:hypothetical protein